jgi:hypothetical protein
MTTSYLRARIARTLLTGAAIVGALLGLPSPSAAQRLSLDTALQAITESEPTIAMPTSGLFEPPDASRERLPVVAHDRGFAIVQASFIGAASMDLAVSMYQIASGNAREGGFGAWWQDSPVAFAASKSAVAVAFAYGLERLHRTRPKLAFVLGVVATSVEGSLVVRSARMER